MQATIQDVNGYPGLHEAISNLLKLKSERDRIEFTCNKLANAIGVPASVLTRLTHPDPEKRVNDPRINTLLKIVDFFRTDGFNVSLDTLLGIQAQGVEIEDQPLDALTHEVKLPLYSLSLGESRQIGKVELNIAVPYSPSIMAFYAEDDLKPIFKKGSIFVIDKQQALANNNLIAIRVEDSGPVIVRRYLREGNTEFIQELDSNNKADFKSLQGSLVIGVIVQIDAKT